ncbi:MAG: hypothetical protein QXX36_02715 [Candidatus Rehaiarchaeum fermentans]|nr:hypothetical protein [Candidatus Rehaiarchaeum fermentans]
MNSHKYMVKSLLELARTKQDAVFKLQCLLEAIEETAILIFKIKDNNPKYKDEVMKYIKNEKELYSIYSRVIDETFNYIINGEFDEGLINDVEKAVLRRLDYYED